MSLRGFSQHVGSMKQAKTLGNDQYTAGNLGAAVEIYSNALSGVDTILLHDNVATVANKEDIPELLDVIALLQNNRAAANLQLGNNKQVVEDTGAVVHNCTIMELLPDIELRAWNSAYRVSPNVLDIYLKARVRRSKAFESMGNTAKASEELTTALARPGGKPLPEDFHETFRQLQQLRHPDAGFIRRTKIDWSSVVGGIWTKLQPKGRSPPVRHNTALFHHNNHVYVYGGMNSFFKSRSDMWDLDLDTLKWKKIQMPDDMHPPSGDQPPVTSYNGCMYIYHGGDQLWRFEPCSGRWSCIQTHWPPECLNERSPKFVRFALPKAAPGYWDYGAAVHGSKMYVFGGSVHGGDVKELSVLACYDFTTNEWEHLFSHDTPEREYPRSPEGRAHLQAWVHGNRFYIHGGRRYRSQSPAMDYMMPERTTLWSWDIDERQWRCELLYSNGGQRTVNIPASRSEHAVAKGGNKAVLYGGYTTAIYHLMDNAMNQFAYLSDAVMFDHEIGEWRYVYCDSWPPYRAGCSMVYVPDPPTEAPTTAAEPGSGAASGSTASSSPAPSATQPAGAGAGATGANLPSASSSSSASGGAGQGPSSSGPSVGSQASRNAIVPGRFILFGGYHGMESEFDDLWELRLVRSPKHIKTLCHGCGKFDTGMLQCGGSCGGALVFCSRECQKSVWETHKQWCKKV